MVCGIEMTLAAVALSAMLEHPPQFARSASMGGRAHLLGCRVGIQIVRAVAWSPILKLWALPGRS